MPTSNSNFVLTNHLTGKKVVPNINILKQLATLIISEVKDIEEEDHLKLGNGFSLDEYVQEFEINIIRYALQIAGENQLVASRLLGIKPTTLNAKIKRYKIHTSRSGRKEWNALPQGKRMMAPAAKGLNRSKAL